jgi:hypothetical protein
VSIVITRTHFSATWREAALMLTNQELNTASWLFESDLHSEASQACRANFRNS